MQPQNHLRQARQQRGMGLLGVVFVVVVIAFAALLTMRIVPSAMEYQAVLKTIQRVKGEGSPGAIRTAFDRAASIDDISAISGKDLVITPDPKSDTSFAVSFAYRKELPLFGPASLLINYKGSTP